MKRASIFARFLALFIDCVILLIFCKLVFLAVFGGYATGAGASFLQGMYEKYGLLVRISVLSSLLVVAFYFTYLTMKGRATIGKTLFKIKVLRTDGSEIGLSRSFFRCIFYVLSALPLFIGFAMALFFRGSTLHDMLADTRVVEEEL